MTNHGHSGPCPPAHRSSHSVGLEEQQPRPQAKGAAVVPSTGVFTSAIPSIGDLRPGFDRGDSEGRGATPSYEAPTAFNPEKRSATIDATLPPQQKSVGPMRVASANGRTPGPVDRRVDVANHSCTPTISDTTKITGCRPRVEGRAA